MPDPETSQTSPDEESQQQDPPSEGAGGETPSYSDFDAWLTAQDEATKALVSGLYDKKTQSLRSALDKERDKATETAKELRELAKTAAQTDAAYADKLNRLATEKETELDSTRKEAAFYRDGAAAGISGEKLARAWTICKNGGYFDRLGDPDLVALKNEIPELFAVPSPPSRSTAGRGTTTKPAPAEEDPIRAAVRRARGH